MPYTIGALEIILRTDLDQFTGGMRRAAESVDQANSRISRSVRATDQSVQQMQRSLGGIRHNIAFSGLSASALLADSNVKTLRASLLLLPAAIGGTGLALGAKQLIAYADAAAEVRNRIAVVTKAGPERVAAEAEVFAIAQKTRAEYTTIAQLYARTAQSAAQLGRSQEDILRFTETVAKTASISGARQPEAQAAAIQLAQGLASNRLQGDELRSVLENNVALAKILAEELAGGSIGKLRELGAGGLISAKAVLDAVLRRQNDVNAAFAKITPTIAQGFTVLDNALAKYIGDIDRGVGASKAMFSAMQSIAENIPTLVTGFLLLASVIPGALIGRGIAPAIAGSFGKITAERKSAAKEAVRSLSDANIELERSVQIRKAAAAVVLDHENPRIPSIIHASSAATREYNQAVAGLIKTKRDLAAAESVLAKAEAGGRVSPRRVAAAETAAVGGRQQLPFAQASVAAAGQKLLASSARERELAVASLALAQHREAEAAAAVARATDQATAAKGRLATSSRFAASAVSLLGNAGLGLVGFLGGPWGVAFTVATAAYLLYQKRTAEAAAETERLKTVLDGVPKKLEDIAAAQNRIAVGKGDPRDVLGAAAFAEDARKAGEIATDAFVNSLQSLPRSALADLAKQFGLVINWGHTAGDIFWRLRDAGVGTEPAIQAVQKRLRELAASGAIPAGIAQSITMLGDAALKAAGQVNLVNRAKKDLELAKDFEGFNAEARRPIEEADQAARENALRQGQENLWLIEAEIGKQEKISAVERERVSANQELAKARRKQRDPSDIGLREEELRRRLREKYPNLPQAEIEDLAKKHRINEDFRRLTQEVAKYDKTVRELSEEAIVAGLAFTELDRETLRYARAAGLSEAEAQKFIQAVSDKRLDQAPDKIRLIREQLEAVAKARLGKDIAFERDQLGRDSIEAAVAARLRSNNLPVDLQSTEAGLIRLTEYLRVAKDASNEFATSFVQDMRAGKTWTEALVNSLSKLADRALTMAIDTGTSGLFKAAQAGLGSLFGPNLATAGVGATGPALGPFATYDSGGIAGVVPFGPRTRLGPLTVADSGFGPRHFPALLERGEMVLDEAMSGRTADALTGMASALAMRHAGGGAQVVVNVQNNAGADVGVGKSRGADGSVTLDVVINRAVRSAMLTDLAGHGPISQGISRRFGADPTRGIG